MSIWQSQKREVLEAAQQMDKKGLVEGTSGNVSMRLKDSSGRELLAITPNNRHYDTMNVDDIQIVDFMQEDAPKFKKFISKLPSSDSQDVRKEERPTG